MAASRKHKEDAKIFHKLNTADGISEQEILTFVLQGLSPRMDAQKVSSALLERFDRFSDVLDAPPEVLMDVPGVDARVASLLSSYPDLFRAYLESKNQPRQRIVDTQCAFQAVRSKFFGRKTEIVVLMILDSKGYLKYMGIVSEGMTRSVPIYIREIVRLCLLYNADAVYIAHNHPSGNCTPSRDDLISTKEMELALSGIDIILSDHFIFSDDDYFSMRTSGVLAKLRQEVKLFKKQLINNA